MKLTELADTLRNYADRLDDIAREFAKEHPDLPVSEADVATAFHDFHLGPLLHGKLAAADIGFEFTIRPDEYQWRIHGPGGGLLLFNGKTSCRPETKPANG